MLQKIMAHLPVKLFPNRHGECHSRCDAFGDKSCVACERSRPVRSFICFTLQLKPQATGVTWHDQQARVLEELRSDVGFGTRRRGDVRGRQLCSDGFVLLGHFSDDFPEERLLSRAAHVFRHMSVAVLHEISLSFWANVRRFDSSVCSRSFKILKCKIGNKI